MRFELLGMELVFICSHLNSGQKETNRRNADFHDILRKLEKATEGCDCLVPLALVGLVNWSHVGVGRRLELSCRQH